MLGVKSHLLKLGPYLMALWAVLALSACSLTMSPSTSTTSVELPTTEISAGGHQITLVSTSPYTYKLNGTVNAFLSIFKECGLSESVSSVSTTRALFVGFDQLKIEKQTKLQVEERLMLQSLASASSENIPIHLAVYSLRDGECVLDYVFWNPVEINSGETQLQNFQEFVRATLALTE